MQYSYICSTDSFKQLYVSKRVVTAAVTRVTAAFAQKGLSCHTTTTTTTTGN